jgi:hypothetical protein
MVTIKRRFRGVRQNLKTARTTFSKRIYDKVYKFWKRKK